MKTQEEQLRKKISQKTRVRKQKKRKVSKSSGTLARQVKRTTLSSKRKKKSTVKVHLKTK